MTARYYAKRNADARYHRLYGDRQRYDCSCGWTVTRAWCRTGQYYDEFIPACPHCGTNQNVVKVGPRVPSPYKR